MEAARRKAMAEMGGLARALAIEAMARASGGERLASRPDGKRP